MRPTNSPLTRRQFLLKARPTWLNKRDFVVAAGVVGAGAVLSVAWSLLREMGWSGTLTMLGLLAAVWLAIQLISSAVRLADRLVERGPLVVAVLLSAAGRCLQFVLIGAAGIHLHQQWSEGSDRPSVIFISCACVLMVIYDEFRRISEHRAQPAEQSAPPGPR